jgi:hypothetical protein
LDEKEVSTIHNDIGDSGHLAALLVPFSRVVLKTMDKIIHDSWFSLQCVKSTEYRVSESRILGRKKFYMLTIYLNETGEQATLCSNQAKTEQKTMYQRLFVATKQKQSERQCTSNSL